MLLRLCPGLTAKKSLDQTQRGIKLTTVQIENSTCEPGRDTARLRASEHADVADSDGSTISEILHISSCVNEAPPGEQMCINTFSVKPCKVAHMLRSLQ